MADWSQLPKDLVGLIAKRIDSAFDLFRFRHVCSTWRSSVAPKRHRFPGRFPLLTNQHNAPNCFSFDVSLSKRTVYLIRSPENAVSGWLIKVNEDDPNIKHLLNPLKRHRFEFSQVLDIQNLSLLEIGHEFVLNCTNYPPSFLSYVYTLFTEKLVLMHLVQEGDLDGFVLLTIHASGKLAIYKCENKDWIILEHMPSPYDDVILFKGKFYAVDNTGRTVFVDHSSCDMSLVANPVFGGDKKYLVECKADLLLVDMYLSIDASVDLSFFTENFEHDAELADCMRERTVMFKVFRLDLKQKEWIEVENLRDDVLFLGEDCVFSASADDLGVSKGDCLLFVDNLVTMSGEGDDDDCCGRHFGLFDLESGCIKPFRNYPDLSKLFWPPPRWVTQPTMLEV